MHTPSTMANLGLGLRHSTVRLALETIAATPGLALSCFALSGCADSAPAPSEANCATQRELPPCVDLPPVARLHFQVGALVNEDDYPFDIGALNAPPIAPQTSVFLSAQGSADPEGEPVITFWNVQDPTGAYLSLEPRASAERAWFVPPQIGRYTVTLQVSEAQGLRQITQLTLPLQVAPTPCAPDGLTSPCADALPVSGGAFAMGSPDGVGDASERPQHRATVAPFALDKYEATVGRFRRFVSQFDPRTLLPGAGARHGDPATGWQAEWSEKLPGSAGEFSFAIAECGGTWSDQPAGNEARPISCITWYEAFAFCISEGKRLPSEAEWEFAAVGGDQQRTYPWGNQPPSPELAVYGCQFDGRPSCSDADLPVVGSLPSGAGRFGQLDLAGSVWEWTLDSYAPYSAEPCVDCSNSSNPEVRVFRGGDFRYDDPSELRGASRYAFNPEFPGQTRGVRCASD